MVRKMAGRLLKEQIQERGGSSLSNQPAKFTITKSQHAVLMLQKAAGNRAVGQMLHSDANQRASISRDVPKMIVPAILRSPSHSLSPTIRAEMGQQFGQNFDSVQVHTNAQAAASAELINAQAYTVGNHIVFGANQYAPETRNGKRLLAHELTHVMQQPKTIHTELTVGEPDSLHEREADMQSQQVLHPSSSAEPVAVSKVSQPVVQRSVLGGVLGGVLGAVGGVVLGAIAGGPLGAVLGGIAGLIGGAAIGDSASTRSRHLTPDEKTMAREVFRDSLDYEEITITRDSLFAAGAPRTIGNTIHLKSSWGHFERDTLDLTDQGKETLIHEMAHVWQYQNGGLAYIPLSLISQLRAAISGGSRDAAYNWREAHAAGLPWEQWNPEQQAAAVEDYNRLLRLTQAGSASAEDYNTLATLLPYIERLRRREGAPTFGIGAPGRDILSGNRSSTP